MAYFFHRAYYFEIFRFESNSVFSEFRSCLGFIILKRRQVAWLFWHSHAHASCPNTTYYPLYVTSLHKIASCSNTLQCWRIYTFITKSQAWACCRTVLTQRLKFVMTLLVVIDAILTSWSVGAPSPTNLWTRVGVLYCCVSSPKTRTRCPVSSPQGPWDPHV